MSHVYEALERAEHERSNIAKDTITAARLGDPLETPAAAVVQEQAASIGFAEKTWNPNATFLPTLAERNDAIEQFRSLRSNLYQSRDQSEVKTIVVSSGLAAEGKTFVATNLALSLARNNDAGVLLIDGDLRKPSIHKVLGTSSSPGLSEYLANGISLPQIMQRSRGDNPTSRQGDKAISHLSFIPAGQTAVGSPELVGNRRFEELIAAAKPHFAWIIIDSPPVLVVTDAVDLARAADAVLLVAREGITPFESLQRAKKSFPHSRILGVVLNAVKHAANKGSYYYGRDRKH